jgi:hypothetical protein
MVTSAGTRPWWNISPPCLHLLTDAFAVKPLYDILLSYEIIKLHGVLTHAPPTPFYMRTTSPTWPLQGQRKSSAGVALRFMKVILSYVQTCAQRSLRSVSARKNLVRYPGALVLPTHRLAATIKVLTGMALHGSDGVLRSTM